ncbi:MAG: hypothetical protein K2Y35_13365 [Burkholderiales bacterium]|nr:hypothetical protein [Burkholderiales bacterium]
MLFAYKYVPHQMEKMQEFIDFIFYEVWCKASTSGAFSLDLFSAKPALHEVMEAFFYSDAKGADFFYGHVERIYRLFAQLTGPQIQHFELWFRGNNDIEKICDNDPAVHLVRYADVPAVHKDLCDELGSFFKGLYSQSLLGLVALQDKIGDIDDHYAAFVKVNDEGKCPFCGISDVFGVYHSKREAYDHYLPKALYPFNSINFRNLVPACHHCNSSYKTSKDPAFTVKDPARSAHRRRVFYPYRTNAQKIEISVTVAHADFKALAPGDISIDFGPPEIDEELDTWRDVYDIDERYKAKIVGKNDGKYWITQAFDEWPARGGTVGEYVADLARQADVSPFADCNFLKRALLEACWNVGRDPPQAATA